MNILTIKPKMKKRLKYKDSQKNATLVDTILFKLVRRSNYLIYQKNCFVYVFFFFLPRSDIG